MRHISDAERRARLVARHHLGATALDVESAIASTVAMHASDPQTPFLGVRARLADQGASGAALESSLYEQRTLWRLHAVRRTIFVATLDDATVLHTAATRAIARKNRLRIHRWLADVLPAKTDVEAWEHTTREQVVEYLCQADSPQRTVELNKVLPRMATRGVNGSGAWASEGPVGSKLLVQWAMDGYVVRARPPGTWRNSQYRWAVADDWFDPPLDLGDSVDADAEAEVNARAALVRRYLQAHGPATQTDVSWWTGWTKRATREALTAVGAVAVSLDGDSPVDARDGHVGYVLADDLDTHEPDANHVALLPGLDPTPMGWKDRGFYLGDHRAALYDRNGNIGPTIWVDGRIVGGWAAREDGTVVTRLLEKVPSRKKAKIDTEVKRLTQWINGQRIIPRFGTPLERELSRGR